MGNLVETSPSTTSARFGSRGDGVDLDFLQQAHIDDEPAIVGAKPGHTMATPADRNVEPLFSGHLYDGAYVAEEVQRTTAAGRQPSSRSPG